MISEIVVKDWKAQSLTIEAGLVKFQLRIWFANHFRFLDWNSFNFWYDPGKHFIIWLSDGTGAWHFISWSSNILFRWNIT